MLRPGIRYLLTVIVPLSYLFETLLLIQHGVLHTVRCALKCFVYLTNFLVSQTHILAYSSVTIFLDLLDIVGRPFQFLSVVSFGNIHHVCNNLTRLVAHEVVLQNSQSYSSLPRYLAVLAGSPLLVWEIFSLISPYTKSTQPSLTVHRFIPHLSLNSYRSPEKLQKRKMSPIRFDHEVRNFKTRITKESLHVLACHAKSTFKSRQENILDISNNITNPMMVQITTLTDILHIANLNAGAGELLARKLGCRCPHVQFVVFGHTFPLQGWRRSSYLRDFIFLMSNY